MCPVADIASSMARPGAVRPPWSDARVHIEQVALIVDDYDRAIRFYVDVLGFELVEDSPAQTNDGRPKRWVVVRPPGAATGVLLARADGERQARAVGDQFAGRVGLFLRVDDFDDAYERMRAAGVEFVTEPRASPTDGWSCSATSRATAGTSWAARSAPRRAPAPDGRRAPPVSCAARGGGSRATRRPPSPARAHP